MLRTDNLIDYTPEDIKKLYEIIAIGAYDTSSSYSNALVVIRKIFFDYFTALSISAPPISKKKSFIDRLDMLIKKDYFVGKYAAEKLHKFKKDLLTNETTIKDKLENEENFISDLIKINEQCLADVPVVNTVPDKLQTGLSSIEKDTIIYGDSYYHSIPAIELCNKGLENLKECKWESAATYFVQAVASEYEIAKQANNSANEQNIVFYQRNIAYAFHMAAIAAVSSKCYQAAINYYRKAILAIQLLEKTIITKNDQELIIRYYRDLADTFNKFAIENVNHNKLGEAIVNIKFAINEVEKITPNYFTEQDEEDCNRYKRHLAYVLNRQGDVYFSQNKFDDAILHYNSAISVLNNIKPEHITEEDNKDLLKYEINSEFAAMTKEDQSLARDDHNNFFKRKNATAEVPTQKIETTKKQRTFK